jgi:hypothetical protein
VVHFSVEYAIYALLARPGSLPWGEASVWIWSWVWVPAIGLLVFLDLLFPDGRLPGPRWRWFARFTIAAVLVGVILTALSSGPILQLPLRNLLGIEVLPNVYRMVEAFMYALVVVGASSMILRLRRVGWIARQQIQWFAYTTAVAISGIVLKNTVYPVVDVTLVWWAGFVLTVVGLAGNPIGMGVAILRYRLYQIDHIINRTLVYGSLTAVLALVYVGSVVVLQGVLRILTGQSRSWLSWSRPSPLCRPVHTVETRHAVVCRSPLLQAQVRCDKDIGSLRCQAQGRDEPRRCEQQPRWRG